MRISDWSSDVCSSDLDMQATQAFIETQGGPEVFDWREVTLGEPGPGQVLVRQTAVGLNYLDTYHRDGTYPVELPSGLGVEAMREAGIESAALRSEEHTSELQSLMRISYAVFCLQTNRKQQ